jgi:subtilase family serine protease
MKKSRRIAVVLLVVGLASCAGQPKEPTPEEVASSLLSLKNYDSEDVCPEAERGPGRARCMARRLKLPTGGVRPHTTVPSGFSPKQLQGIYQLDPTRGNGVTVAIVSAMDDPNAESDLAVYRSYFGLAACTTANGCFKKVNQDGLSAYPASAADWAEATSISLDMVSAACPNCRILLVEANSDSWADLGAAVNKAAQLGALVISNSYGGPEDGMSATYDAQYFSHPGVGMFACAGDSGLAGGGGIGASYPATGHDVIAVGGTSLTVAPSTARGWSETAWSGTWDTGASGSGCSVRIAKPAWQQDNQTYPGGCAKRMEVDVSAVADPHTGVAVYDSYQNSGWLVEGGTSVSTPFVAAVFANYQIPTRPGGATGEFAWTNPGDFFDVTSGSNGKCSPAYECTAGPGYDGPTGWGTPNGAAFSAGCFPECEPRHCGLDHCGGICFCK